MNLFQPQDYTCVKILDFKDLHTIHHFCKLTRQENTWKDYRCKTYYIQEWNNIDSTIFWLNFNLIHQFNFFYITINRNSATHNLSNCHSEVWLYVHLAPTWKKNGHLYHTLEVWFIYEHLNDNRQSCQSSVWDTILSLALIWWRYKHLISIQQCSRPSGYN